MLFGARARVFVALLLLCSWPVHADYDAEREALDSSIQQITDLGVTNILLYERDTETPAEEGYEMASYLAQEIYGGLPVSMPIHLVHSLREGERVVSTAGAFTLYEPDEMNLSTSILHDLQDLHAIFAAATEAGLHLETFKVAEGRSAGAVFNAIAGPSEENRQRPHGWPSSSQVMEHDLQFALDELVDEISMNGHSLNGIVLHQAQAQLSQAFLSPDPVLAAGSALSLLVPADRAGAIVASTLAKVVEGDARLGIGDVIGLLGKILWQETIGTVVDIGRHLLAAEFDVAGSRTPVEIDMGFFSAVLEPEVIGGMLLVQVLETLDCSMYIDAYAPLEGMTRRQELMLQAQGSYMSEVAYFASERVQFCDWSANGYVDAAEFVRGPERPNQEPVIQRISGLAINRGDCGSCDIRVQDWDTDEIDVHLFPDSPGMLFNAVSVPGLFTAEYIFCSDNSSPSVFDVILSATDNRSLAVRETFTVVVMNIPPCVQSGTGCESRGRFASSGSYASIGPSVFTMDPAWYEAGCLQFRDLDGDALTFRVSQMPEFGRINLMTSGLPG